MSTRERQFFNEGKQHRVFLPRYSKLDNQTPSYVIKIPKLFHWLPFSLLKFKAKDISRDFMEAEDLAKTTLIKIPRTKIIPFKNAYAIAQELITPNGNVENIPEKLTNSQYLLDQYLSNPRNFVCRDGTIYFVDPIKDNFLRLLSSIGFNYYSLYHKRVRLKLFCQRFGLA